MKQKTIVRTLAEADPAYAVAAALLTKLKTNLVTLDREEDALRCRLANRKPGAETTSRVAALLGELTHDDAAAPDGISARLKTIAVERIDLRAAIEIAQKRVSAARQGASSIICAEVRAEYAERVKAVAAALTAAHAANLAVLELIDELNDHEIMWVGSMPPMQADRILGHRGDRVGAWLHEAVAAGFVSKTDIPKDLAV